MPLLSWDFAWGMLVGGCLSFFIMGLIILRDNYLEDKELEEANRDESEESNEVK